MQRQDTTPRLGRLARLALCVLPALTLAAGCGSTEREKDPLGMTKEERLGLYLENAEYYSRLGDVDRMIFQAEKGLELDPKNERFLLIYARGYLLRGAANDIQRSIDVLRALEVKEDWRVQSTLGMALERKGVLYDEAADAVRTGERPTDALDPAARADELRAEAQDFWTEAREHFVRSNALKSGELEPLNGLVRVSGLLGDYEGCVAWSDKLLSSIQSAQRLIEDELQASAAQPSAGGEAADKETRAFRDLRAFRNLEIKSRLTLAEVHFRQGQHRDAVEQLDLVTALDPELMQVYSQRAQVLYELGEYRRAKDSIQRYLELRAVQDGAESDPSVVRAFELSEACDRALARR